MSFHFDKPLNAAARKLLVEKLGEPFAEDGRNFLFNDCKGIHRPSHVFPIYAASGQQLTFKLPALGHVRTLDDGRTFEWNGEWRSK